ncbi:MAG TPA: NBR1-Ig-like domain-containing protein [Anaerolineales bacterium]|nr:NBR1-Ig-like domain-containing protein [Anaerolineales bacterium]
MKLTTNSILYSLGVIGLLIIACVAITMLAVPLVQADQPGMDDANATIQAIVTQTVYALTQNAPTSTSVPVTNTSVPPSNTPAPTSTPLPTSTTVSYCDWVTFVKDVTIPDGTKFIAGETFTKTWRLQNRGTCTWTSDYMLVFSSGDPMGGTTAVRLPGTVYPGQTVDVSVTLTAPAKRGRFVGYWMLRNPSGTLFGYGDNANRAFYVEIRTEDLPHGTVSGNFQYPSEFNPPLILYFENAVTREIIQFSIPERNFTYSVLLPNGTYYAYAWAPGYNLQGAFVNQNLTMKTFVVNGGQTTSGIHLTDWSPYPHSYGQ